MAGVMLMSAWPAVTKPSPDSANGSTRARATGRVGRAAPPGGLRAAHGTIWSPDLTAATTSAAADGGSRREKQPEHERNNTGVLEEERLTRSM